MCVPKCAELSHLSCAVVFGWGLRGLRDRVGSCVGLGQGVVVWDKGERGLHQVRVEHTQEGCPAAESGCVWPSCLLAAFGMQAVTHCCPHCCNVTLWYPWSQPAGRRLPAALAGSWQ